MASNPFALADPRQSELLFRGLLESAPDAMLVAGADGTILFANAQLETLFGYAREELVGRPVEILVPQQHRERHVGLREAYSRQPTVRPMGALIDLHGVRKDGSEFPVEISLGPIRCSLGLLLTCAIRDATERRQALRAERLAKAELARSNEDLDDFAYIVSHDLKEPLRGIGNYASFLLEDYAGRLDDEGKRMLQTLGRLTEHLGSLLERLLYYSRIGRTALSTARVDLQALVADVIASLSVVLEEHHGEVRIPQPLPALVCDGVRLGEVFRNLITNGLKYNESRPKVVEIGCRPGRDPVTGQAPVLYVRDNGIGIAAKHRETVFAMFKRLHPRDRFGGGTGAGLTIVRKLVERHGGRIWVESTPGAGSTFCFTLGTESP